ncbi:uncharacterized protein LOC127812741 [Diospyros lotus]|uniref:uncharacterized protein LOC127812741 n=1 Tax=Diospyros lotus TaxID=55363 RepID=UPI00224DDDC3|nr:uncharacterized protein LOC127812741 [Diospyros lotus]
MNYWDLDNDNDDLGEEEENNEGEEYDEVGEMLGEMYEGTNAEGQTEDHDPNVGMEECFFVRLLREAQRELYPGWQDVSLLSFLVKILHLKELNKWSNKSFEMTLQLFKEVLPKHSTIPNSPYEVKKILRDLGLGYVYIDACKNDCVLFWKELSERNTCPICEEPRWKIDDNKSKWVPHKILRYFPLTPRLKRLFMSKQTTLAMRWHKEKRKEESNILSHPANGEAWKHLDLLYPDFAQDSRNVRLALATDGFNPFGNMSTSYSMWPVILVQYNMPLWKCMKEPFFMMSLLILGPRAPGKDIDTYLPPLIDELNELWTHGVQTYDAVTKENFQMKVVLLWTINDFPAYGNLSGWITKRYKACPICYDDPPSRLLRRKIGYLCSRQFLPPNHRWRRNANAFDGKVEK